MVDGTMQADSVKNLNRLISELLKAYLERVVGMGRSWRKGWISGRGKSRGWGARRHCNPVCVMWLRIIGAEYEH